MMSAKTNHVEASRALIEALRKGDTKALRELYATTRPKFLNWARQSGLDESDLLDVFQDSVIIFYKNVTSGKISDLGSSHETYLFGIAKHLMAKKQQSMNRVMRVEKIEDMLLGSLDMSIYTQIELNHRQRVLGDLLVRLGDMCMAILRFFYYENFSLEAIAERLSYENESVVRTQKSRCLAKLREAYFSQKTR